MNQTVTLQRGWKWCTDPRCDGHAQVPCDVEVELTSWTYGDNTGTKSGLGDPLARMEERSHTALRFPEADRDKSACVVCGRNLELGLEERPVYEPLSGFDPRGLMRLKMLGINYDAAKQQAMREAVAKPATGETPGERLAFLFVDGSISADEYQYRKAVLEGIEPTSDPAPGHSEPAGLPPGIRMRSNGHYQAFWRDEHGKQQHETRDTLDEAVSVREHRVAEVAELRAARDE